MRQQIPGLAGIGLTLSGVIAWTTIRDPVAAALWTVGLTVLGMLLVGFHLGMSGITTIDYRRLGEALFVVGIVVFVVISNPVENARSLRSGLSTGSILVILGISLTLLGVFLWAAGVGSEKRSERKDE